tara:strand:- start:179 stop:874 length:696 start_codon:yes stop_codon:yes gene_type:complete
MGIRRGSITTPIVVDGLVLNMDAANRSSYPKTGTTWTDTIDGNNGTLTNGPVFNSADGGSIDFDGSDDYVLTPFTFPKSDIISINLWAKHSSITTSANPGLFQCQNNGSSPTSTKVIGGWVQSNGIVWGRVIDTSGTKNLPRIAESTISVGDWFYFSFIADGSNYKLYINGDFKTEIAYNGTINNYNRIFLAIQGSEPSDCNISNVHIYNRALSASEVLQNYNALKGRFGL